MHNAKKNAVSQCTQTFNIASQYAMSTQLFLITHHKIEHKIQNIQIKHSINMNSIHEYEVRTQSNN